MAAVAPDLYMVSAKTSSGECHVGTLRANNSYAGRGSTMANSDSERFSPVVVARVLGAVTLAGIVTGAFDIGYVQKTLIVASDASATLHNISAHETLFRAGSVLGAFNLEQLHVVSNLSTKLQQAGLLLSWVFYGIDELTGGFLIFRSGFLPRILGALLALSGLCYFTHGYLSFLAPSLDARLYPYILYPCAPGEILISIWLATRGLNLRRWRAWDGRTGG